MSYDAEAKTSDGNYVAQGMQMSLQIVYLAWS